MLITLHKNATTTPAVRAAIQKATGSDYELARQFNVSRDTTAKWRKREVVHDASHTAHRLHTTLNAGQEERGVRGAMEQPTDLEQLTKQRRRANTGDATSQAQECGVSVDRAFEADAQLAEGGQPGIRALNYPPMTPEPVIALDASAGDAVLGAATLQVYAPTCVVVTLVGMQLVGPAARPSAAACTRGQGIDEVFEDH